MQVSQSGNLVERPPILVRFQSAIGGAGNITGPYRGYLHYWKTTRNDVIDEVSAALWPFLSQDKRGQLARAAEQVGRATPWRSAPRPAMEEPAWAAGLFDGEGSIYVAKRGAWRGLQLYLSQSSIGDAPDTIIRFHAAIGGRGSLSGPHPPRSPWSRLPQYHWSAHGRHVVSDVIGVLWPCLGVINRAKLFAWRVLLDPNVTDLIERDFV